MILNFLPFQSSLLMTHPPPPTPQLLTIKEEADNKVPLVRMS